MSDEALEEAADVCTERLEEKVPMDLMRQIAACFDLEAPFPRDKAGMAELLSEQLHYETDSDDDDDDDEEDDE